MTTEKRRHDWRSLEGEALELALTEACGDPPDGSDDWDGPDSLLTFENLSAIVWKQYVKPRGWSQIALYWGGFEATAYVGRSEPVVRRSMSLGRTPEEALARALGEALEAGE